MMGSIWEAGTGGERTFRRTHLSQGTLGRAQDVLGESGGSRWGRGNEEIRPEGR